MIYIELFLSFLQIGAFGFGGGYAALPLVQGQVVDVHGWLTFQEFSDLITISQMTPGPIVINAATFVGIRIAGIGGALAATLGSIFPACILVSLLAVVYRKYQNVNLMQQILASLRPAVVAMIASAGLSIMISSFVGEGEEMGIRVQNVVIFVLSVYLLRKKKMNPVGVMVIAGILEVIYAAVNVN